MRLNRLQIGERIRNIREEVLKFTRIDFANVCQITERQLGKIERGECLMTLDTLHRILNATGADANYILYGEKNTKESIRKEQLKTIIDRSVEEEIQIYYNTIFSMHSYIENIKK